MRNRACKPVEKRKPRWGLLLAITATARAQAWDPELLALDAFWTSRHASARPTLEIGALYSHNLTALRTGSVSLTVACGGAPELRGTLAEIGGAVAVFSLVNSDGSESNSEHNNVCSVRIEDGAGVLASDWTGSPIPELQVLAIPCGGIRDAMSVDGVTVTGLASLCSIIGGHSATPLQFRLQWHDHQLPLVLDPFVDISASSILNEELLPPAAAFVETDAAAIPGLDQIVGLAMKLLMPPVMDPFLEKVSDIALHGLVRMPRWQYPQSHSSAVPFSSLSDLLQINDHLTHTLSETVAKDVTANTPKDTMTALEPDLRRNLTALLPDSVTAALTPLLTARLTDTVAPPLVEQLVQTLGEGLQNSLAVALHRRISTPLEATLPDRLRRSLLVSLTHTLTHSLTHVLVPAVGEALLEDSFSRLSVSETAGGGALPQFPIPLSEQCARCPADPAVADKTSCWACRRDALRYQVLHHSHCKSLAICVGGGLGGGWGGGSSCVARLEEG
jgi:hypothetical protein